jgi:hypothetical protein
MKEHFCSAEKSMITYEGSCNWCGEREGSMTQDEIIEMARQVEGDASMIEVLKQAYQLLLTEPHAPTVCDQLEVIFRRAIAELESQEPVAWITLQKEAQQIVESKVLWKRFIDGTPLVNDIACWMADFALQHTHPPQLEQNFCPRCGKRTNDIHTCTPPQRSESSGKPSAWVGLTDDEISALSKGHIVRSTYARAIEAHLKQKNGFAEEKNT